MIKLASCSFEGLQGFESLEFSPLGKVTALIGPNGSGKSSALQILSFAIELIGARALSEILPPHDEWVRFHLAKLTFQKHEKFNIPCLSEHFGSLSEKIEIEIKCENGEFHINKITCDDGSLEFEKPKATRSSIKEIESSINQTIDRIKTERERNQKGTPEQKKAAQKTIEQLTNKHEALKTSLADSLKAIAKSSDNTRSVDLSHADIEKFFSEINLPTVIFISANERPDIAIPNLIKDLIALKVSTKRDAGKFLEATLRLSKLLQSDVDVFERDGVQHLKINGVSYEKASSGTSTSLAFFGLTRLGEENCLVLWDEPENGLHPTRRSRLLDLMFSDTRQFILATHASELAPVFNADGVVYRCASHYKSDYETVHISTSRVADRREAFRTLEALGVHPAKALFTTNVVIWVEGPTELLFYRKWLKGHLMALDIIEGFHYAFLQYGGGLISYLEAADESEFKSTIDLLSLCRHPIILVDSDLREDPKGEPAKDFLKLGASKLLQQVQSLNAEKENSALFFYTRGREIENYMPESSILYAASTLWKNSANYQSAFSVESFSFGQFDSYSDALAAHLIAHNAFNTNESSAEKTAKGISVWGPSNKVEMMRTALDMPNLNEKDLRWDCQNHLLKIKEFIISKAEEE